MTGETVYTLENLTDFYRIAAMRMGARRYRLIRLVYLLAGAGLILIGIYEGLAMLGGDGDIVVILLTALGLYLGVQMLRTGRRFYSYFASHAIKSIPKDSQRCFFSFEDEQVVISNRLISTSFPSEQFGVIYETADRFFFFINAYNGYILEKDGIDGTAEQLRSLLNSKREDAVQPLELG